MRFKEVLSKYGITQIELANRLGINRVSVSRLFKEDNDMRTSTLYKIADAIGCDVTEFFKEDTTEAKPQSGIIKCPHCGKDITLKVE